MVQIELQIYVPGTALNFTSRIVHFEQSVWEDTMNFFHAHLLMLLCKAFFLTTGKICQSNHLESYAAAFIRESLMICAVGLQKIADFPTSLFGIAGVAAVDVSIDDKEAMMQLMQGRNWSMDCQNSEAA